MRNQLTFIRAIQVQIDPALTSLTLNALVLHSYRLPPQDRTTIATITRAINLL